MIVCEIEGCGRPSTCTTSGIRTCDRCAREFVSCGPGAVYFSGRWHGVVSATYSADQMAAFPGVESAS